MELWEYRLGTFRMKMDKSWLPINLVCLVFLQLLNIPLKIKGKQVGKSKKGVPGEIPQSRAITIFQAVTKVYRSLGWAS